MLVTRLRQLMEEQKLSGRQLEKLANLKNGAVRNILSGQSKKPSAETILALSRILKCSMEYLLGEQTDSNQNTFQKEQDKVVDRINTEVFLQACQKVIDVSQKLDINLSLDTLLLCIKNVYNYTSQKEPPLVDEHFVKWLIESKC